jgi:hypothetical protein
VGGRLMIRLKEIKEKHKLVLTPAVGFGKSNPERVYDLNYGIRCPVCDNVILAQITHNDVFPDLWGYEETKIMKHKTAVGGISPDKYEVSRFLPDYEKLRADTKMLYEITQEDSLSGSSKYTTTLRLTNHIYKPSILNEQPINRSERGDKPCLYAGFVSFNREMAFRLAMTGGRISESLNLGYLPLDLTRLPEIEVAIVEGSQSYKKYILFLQSVGPITVYAGLYDVTYMVNPSTLSLPSSIINTFKTTAKDYLGYKEN